MKIEIQQNVAAEGAPGVRRTADANTDLMGSAARGLGSVGAGLQDLGTGVYRGAQVAQALLNETLAKDADVQATRELMDLEYDPKNGYMTKKGKNAVEAYSDTMKAADEVRRKYLDALPNDNAKKMFDQVFVRRLQYSMQTIGSHASRENLAWMKDTSKAREATLVSEGALNWNNLDRFQRVTIPSIIDEIKSRAELEGHGPEQVQRDIQVAVDAAHVTRLKAMTPYDPKGAIGQLQEIAPQLSAQGRIAAENEIMHGVRLAHEQQMWAEHAAVKARQDQDEKIGQDFFSKFVSGKLSAVDIDQSQLSVPKKQHWFGMVASQVRKDERLENNNPTIVADILRKINLPYGNKEKITDISDIYAMVGNGVSLTAAGTLVKMVVDMRTPEGIRLADVRNRAFTNLRPQFVHDTNLGPDILGGKDFFEFQQAVVEKEQELRAKKEDPHQLYDPKSPHFIGKMADQYKATFQQRLKRNLQGLNSFGGNDPRPTDPKVAPVLQRKPGESITDYLERAGASGGK